MAYLDKQLEKLKKYLPKDFEYKKLSSGKRILVKVSKDKEAKGYIQRIYKLVPKDVKIYKLKNHRKLVVDFPYIPTTPEGGTDTTQPNYNKEFSDSLPDVHFKGLTYKTKQDAVKSVKKVLKTKASLRSKLRAFLSIHNRMPSIIEKTEDKEKKKNLKMVYLYFDKIIKNLKSK